VIFQKGILAEKPQEAGTRVKVCSVEDLPIDFVPVLELQALGE